MKKMAALTTFTASMLASFAAQATDSAELSVQGVIRPVACNLSLSQGGVVKYGTIPASALISGEVTTLEDKDISFSITCSAATKIAFKASDNRSNSIVPGIDSGMPDSFLYGLGSVSGKNVGSYQLHLARASVLTDNGQAKQIVSADENQTWTPSIGLNSAMFANNNAFSWSTPNGNAPAPFKTVTGTIQVFTHIDKPENLPLTQDVPLDGSATLEIVYL